MLARGCDRLVEEGEADFAGEFTEEFFLEVGRDRRAGGGGRGGSVKGGEEGDVAWDVSVTVGLLTEMLEEVWFVRLAWFVRGRRASTATLPWSLGIGGVRSALGVASRIGIEARYMCTVVFVVVVVVVVVVVGSGLGT